MPTKIDTKSANARRDGLRNQRGSTIFFGQANYGAHLVAEISMEENML
jgi:hypothetical protein